MMHASITAALPSDASPPAFAPSGSSPGPFAALERAFATLLSDPRFADHAVVRPHPLLVSVSKADLFVLLVPAEVSERGREVLRPLSPRLASGSAMIVWLG